MRLILALVVASAFAGPRTESARLEAEAVELLAKDRAVEAIALLDRAIRLDPKNAAAYANRCTARYTLGDFDGAIADHAATKKLAPSLARALAVSVSDAHYRRALRLVDAGKRAEAASELYASVRHDRKNALAYAELGYLALAEGRAKTALGHLDRALALSPDQAQARANRAAARHRLGDLKGAREDAARAIALDESLRPALAPLLGP